MTNVTQLVDPLAGMFATEEEVGAPQSHLIYGYPGRWKTSIGASILAVPNFNRLFFLDVDNGSEVLFSHPTYGSFFKQALREGRLNIFKVSKLDPHAMDKIDFAIKTYTETDYGYDAFLWDTLDVSQDIAEKVFKQQFKGFDVWNALGEWTSDHMWRLQNCPHLVGVTTCHAKETTKQDGAYRLLPSLSGSSKDNIGGIPSVVAYVDFQTDGEGKEHLVANMGTTGSMITKNRFALPPYFVDFDMPKLYAQIESGLSAVTIDQTENAAVAA